MKKSFLPIDPESCFPLENLPYGVFESQEGKKGVAVAVGDFLVDLGELERAGLFSRQCVSAFQMPSLRPFLEQGAKTWAAVRLRLQELLSAECPDVRDNESLRQAAIRKQSEVRMCMPMDIPNYTDFYSSREHASNVGSMFRDPQNPLLPNWLHVPVAYHGRASSVVVSGTPVHRPRGQSKKESATLPEFGPSTELDFELELGCIIGKGNTLGQPIPIERAHEHIFGFVLVNDWSARDIQRWEYVPLGPFLAKNFLTSISPWIVPLAALEPFRVPGPLQDPAPLEYLQGEGNWNFDIALSVHLSTRKTPEPGLISRSNTKYLYWNICQQIAHHTSNGCNLEIGDLLASGTISGPSPESRGSLLELAWRGEKPLRLPNGEERVFLQNGDVLSIRGFAQGADYRIGFGEVSGEISEVSKEAT